MNVSGRNQHARGGEPSRIARVRVWVPLLGILGCLACGPPDGDKDAPSRGESAMGAVIPVETLKLKPQSFEDAFPAPGTIEANEEVTISAEIAGRVVKLTKDIGDEVKKGQPLVALEAMKMEHVVRAPRDGKVLAVAVTVGEMVNGGVAVAEMDGEA